MMRVGVLFVLLSMSWGCDRGAGASKSGGATPKKDDAGPSSDETQTKEGLPNDGGDDGRQLREVKNYFALKAAHRAVEKATSQIDCPSMKEAFVRLSAAGVTDAYGVEMRVGCRDGDLEIRSSGPDKVFGNEDDDVMMNKESKVKIVH